MGWPPASFCYNPLRILELQTCHTLTRRNSTKTFSVAASAWSDSRHDDSSYLRFHSERPAKPDHYTLLGVKPDASLAEIKAAFRKLVLKYHPDVNSNVGAVDDFKRVHVAYETLSDSNNRRAYDYSLRMEAQTSRRKTMNTYPYGSPYGTQGVSWHQRHNSSKGPWTYDSAPTKNTVDDFVENVQGKDIPNSWVKHRVRCIQKGWEKSLVKMLLIFFSVGFICQTFGVQLALTYFVFFLPHNEDHTLWYRFAGLVTWLIGGTRGLFLQYAVATIGWLYGKGYDMGLAFLVSVLWMGINFPQVSYVPQGAILLVAYIYLDV